MEWARLADAVIQQRRRHGWSQRDLAARASVGERTIARLESGRESISENSLISIEAALGWEPGSIRRVLEGHDPTPEADPDLRALIELWPRIPPRQRAALRHMAEQMTAD